MAEEQAYTHLGSSEVPALLAHGTQWRFLDSIKRVGLKPGGLSSQRRHIHLIDADIESTKIKSGFREGSEVVLFIAGKEAADAGIQFYVSANNVYLTSDVIPPLFFRGTRDLSTGSEYDAEGRLCASESLRTNS